jgi:hypothetical protein
MNWFSWLFSKIDPNTPIHVWEVDFIEYSFMPLMSNKTRRIDTTWKESGKYIKDAKIYLPKANFDQNHPIVIIGLTVLKTEGSFSSCAACTTEEFEKKYGWITTRTPSKRIAWYDSARKSLKGVIVLEKLLLSSLTSIKGDLQELKKLFDKILTTGLTPAQRKIRYPGDTPNVPPEPE